MPPATESFPPPSPRQFTGVTISSTFEDLKEHRDALIEILQGQELFPIAMEHDSARPDTDVLDASLAKVGDGEAYVGIIGHRYGQVPPCARRNPENLSITELEFNEAQRLGRLILLFLMGDDHPLKVADVEVDPDRRQKLMAFRERAKQMEPDSVVHRVYATFESLEQFKEKAARAVAKLGIYLRTQAVLGSAGPGDAAPPDAGFAGQPLIPTPPAFYADPPYIGSHRFVGRRAELDRLSDWAAPADPHPVMLFEAIGGTGKSMLTWEWVTKHATTVRGDWAGRFWYSFYEKGAIMADFCRRALAYITGQPLRDFQKAKTLELSELLLGHLRARPWLLVLDGLERVLVAYHRLDAAQLADEEAGRSDQVAQRDPCDAIRPEDDELLRMLAGAEPSKLLLTSRLTPRALLNPSSQAIPGVLRVPLPGLRPPDAEALLRLCGIDGNSHDIQHYLKIHCDCHPLVTGVLAGLVSHYLPDRGNFDAWAADPDAGGHLNLANLNLVQKRNHILNVALRALPEKSRELLSTLALLSEAVDYETLSAFNPHLPPELEVVHEPSPPEATWPLATMSPRERKEVQRRYAEQQRAWREYTEAMSARSQSDVFRNAPREFESTLDDLDRRGLLQYDHQARRYDLHPVVRGIAAGRLGQDEATRYGLRMVDYFSQQTHGPYEEAEKLEDLQHSIQIVRTLSRIGRREQACSALTEELLSALHVNLEAHAEEVSLIRAVLSGGWDVLPRDLPASASTRLLHGAGLALRKIGAWPEALAAYETSLRGDLQARNWSGIEVNLFDISHVFGDMRRFAKKESYSIRALQVAEMLGDKEAVFANLLNRFEHLAVTGRRQAAEMMWRRLNGMGRQWSRSQYRPGDAEVKHARFRFWQGELQDAHLIVAEDGATAAKNRRAIRDLHLLRGTWRLSQGEWALAAESLAEAVRMAREVGAMNSAAASRLAIAKFHLGQLSDPVHEAERLSRQKVVDHRAVAELWLISGNPEQARRHALIAYEQAWADGEPYVFKHALDRARELLAELGVAPPELPPYDPATDPKLAWEDEIDRAIKFMRLEWRR